MSSLTNRETSQLLWANVNYPFGHLLVTRYITTTPEGTIDMYNFATLWLYVVMTDDAESCNTDALTLGLWSRYLSDAQLVGIGVVDGETFVELVNGVRVWLQEDKDRLGPHHDTVTRILWETTNVDIHVWWRTFHQLGSELDLPLFDNDFSRSWCRFIRHWDQLALNGLAFTEQKVEKPEVGHGLEWFVGVGAVSLVVYGVMSWLYRD